MAKLLGGDDLVPVQDFQYTMQRVWLDNSLMNGLEEVRILLEQIKQSSEESKKILGQLSADIGTREALQKEWGRKISMMESFINSSTSILKQYREECERLES